MFATPQHRSVCHVVCMIALLVFASLASAQTSPTPVERRAQLQQDLQTRQAEYDAATKELTQLNADLETKRKEHATLVAGKDQAKIDVSSRELAVLVDQVRLAQERVDLAISQRKTVQTQLAQLEKELAPAPPGTTEKPAAKTQKTPTTAIPGVPATTNPPTETATKPISPRVTEAETVASKKEAEASAARESAREVEVRKKQLEESIATERERLDTTHKRYNNYTETALKLQTELTTALEAGKQYSELGELIARRDEAHKQLRAISDELTECGNRIQSLQSQLLGLQQEQLLAAQDVAAKEAAAKSAAWERWRVTLTEFAIVSLPRLAIVVGIIFLLQYVLGIIRKRLLSRWSDKEQQRNDRARTLVNVIENALRTALYVIGTIVILDIARVPVSTLLGGVAVAGLAVAFGAQNLIRDYFTGFMILLEDQYKINDTVTINSMTGTVERFTLRVTVLRDYEGKVFFIPNGQITSVINQTHEWSRAVLDIRVSYKHRVETVLGALFELGQGIAHDPALGGALLREPELLGVERLEESAMVVRLCLVTRPQVKDSIRREMLRRIKTRFDELGIEIPLPQRMVHHPAGEVEPTLPEAADNTNGAPRAKPAIEEA